MISFEAATGAYHPDGPDHWLNTLGLDSSNTIPGAPYPYLQDVLDGQVVYIIGAPSSWGVDNFKELFSGCGEVLKSPSVIDLVSQNVFRWVILSKPEEATQAIKILNGVVIDGQPLRLIRALAPGMSITFTQAYSLEDFMKWQLSPPSLIPRDTSDSDLAANTTPVAPISIVIQPPTPPTPLTAATVAAVTASVTLPADGPSPVNVSTPVLPIAAPLQLPDPYARPNAAALLDGFVPMAVTWANIVRGPIPASEQYPPRKNFRNLPLVRSVQREEPSAETEEETMRVILLCDIPHHISYSNISDAIKEGSLVSEALAPPTSLFNNSESNFRFVV